MEQTEVKLLQDITRLFADLNVATYGRERANGRFSPPDANKFYYSTIRLYEVTNELVEKYQPAYITESDYRFIYDSQKSLLLELNVFRDKNKLQGEYLTWELKKYLSKIESLFFCVLSYCKNNF